MICNSTLSGVRDDVRQSALTSFHFFSNTLCGAALEEDLCDLVQCAVEQRCHIVLVTERVKQLERALRTWLPTQSVLVADDLPPQRNEILEYFDVVPTEQINAAVSLLATRGTLELLWENHDAS